ncbi:MAG: DNA gyrase subunit A, partial [Methylococcales bacterium]|nr:DNA gyrase subunit A [Methylococcales bacterium]
VIGKYHPHGVASVYDAMVLMAQPFSLRHPLIDGQGNWGSLDGDSPAAMRYTECRMARFAQVFLEEINKGTVDFRPNYDGNDLEPVTLPVRVPAVLLNDQMGIAVGMASDIPAHNLGETCKAAIALFKNPNTTLLGLMRHIKGPDFPCGAQVINRREELEEIYATGRGMLTVRARYEVKKDAD